MTFAQVRLRAAARQFGPGAVPGALPRARPQGHRADPARYAGGGQHDRGRLQGRERRHPRDARGFLDRPPLPLARSLARRRRLADVARSWRARSSRRNRCTRACWHRASSTTRRPPSPCRSSSKASSTSSPWPIPGSANPGIRRARCRRASRACAAMPPADVKEYQGEGNNTTAEIGHADAVHSARPPGHRAHRARARGARPEVHRRIHRHQQRRRHPGAAAEVGRPGLHLARSLPRPDLRPLPRQHHAQRRARRPAAATTSRPNSRCRPTSAPRPTTSSSSPIRRATTAPARCSRRDERNNTRGSTDPMIIELAAADRHPGHGHRRARQSRGRRRRRRSNGR